MTPQLVLIWFIISGAVAEYERHPNDGIYNNLIHPDWGAIDTHLLRRSPADFSDGVYEPSGVDRPNPLEISQAAFKGKDGQFSARGRNALLVFFGQQLVEEILDAQRPGCPREFMNIKVPKDHKYNPHKLDDLEMPFLRSRYDQTTGHSPNNPRQQLNEITPYIDGTLVYGAGKAVEDALREFKDGRLAPDPSITGTDIKSSFPIKNDIKLPFANPPPPRDHVLKPVNRFRRYGNPRAHENPFMLSLHTVWFRYHNYVAQELKSKHSHWNDEELFIAARKRVIAQYQQIVMYDWLPTWLKVEDDKTTTFNISQYPYIGGDLNKYEGYDPNIHPGISQEFQAAAMRFGHTLVPSGVRTVGTSFGQCNVSTSTRKMHKDFTNYNGTDVMVMIQGVRLCNAFWVPEESVEADPGIDDVIRGMIFTLSAREDNIIVSDIRENVFGPLDWSRRDLPALNIQRGRDHGLPGYNNVRKAYGLKRKKTWTEIGNGTDYPQLLARLSRLYNQSETDAPDQVDVFVGGLLETTLDGPGELFRAVLLDQFLRIRHGDRFWFENTDNKLFDNAELDDIRGTTFADVLDATTNVFHSISKPTGNIFLCKKTSMCECQGYDVDTPTYNDTQSNVSFPQEKCVGLKHYDYFSGSETSFIVTVVMIILSLPATIMVMILLARRRKASLDNAHRTKTMRPHMKPGEFLATEWTGRSHESDFLKQSSTLERDVKIRFDTDRKKIFISNLRGHVFRLIDLRRSRKSSEMDAKVVSTRSADKGCRLLMMAVPGEIDLVLYFPSKQERDEAHLHMDTFCIAQGWVFRNAPPMNEHIMWREAYTKDQRDKELAKFFKSVLSSLSTDFSAIVDDSSVDEDVLETKLTRTEFADAMGLQPHSIFVRNMFLLTDSSGDGSICFHEFKSYFGILCSGTPTEKADIFFKMFDISRTGKLSRDNYKKMIQSLLELQDNPDTAMDVDGMVDTVFRQLGKQSTDFLTLEDFRKVMFSGTDDVWNSAVLDLEVAGETLAAPRGPARRKTVKNRAVSFFLGYSQSVHQPEASPRRSRPVSRTVSAEVTSVSKAKAVESTSWHNRFRRYVDNHSRQMFWLILYTLVTCGIFIERAYFYSTEREHAGLRRMASYGISITRGAASAQMFTYASLLVTMSRNTLTFFRETFLHRYIPFDNMHDMHIYVAWMAIFFTVIHVVGHLFNFYHISTQASLDLNCYFREYFRSTDTLASFHYWTYQTLTGLTGVCLTLVLVVMFVFASPYARRHTFLSFKYTHSMYTVVYLLMFLHGAARLVQIPLWPYFFLGPMVVFIMDKMVSISRSKVLLPVHKATLLPSGVINLVFKRPLSFDYQSGQWVRIACPALGGGEYHPFTLTSAPHENRLSLHIRAVGPWTNNIRRIFDPNTAHAQGQYPRIFLDGPFGESHQDWYRYKVAVLVGGGIGVTPFASILKDIASRSKQTARFTCEKVYFLWVTRTQKSFEWMTDIIRAVEQADVQDFLSVQIFITELKTKFDLRTTMLYMCERHFQKIAGVSMFTGLRATTHFGRPRFQDFFDGLKREHSNVDQIGVFSCGPPPMTRSVQTACVSNNRFSGPSLIHHFENF